MDNEKARECAASVVFGGRHSRHGWERRPRPFPWNTIGAEEKKDAMRKSMNRWKNGAIGLLTMVASSVVVIGCGGDSDRSSSRHVPKDTLVVKGLYMGMPGDDAVEACKELVGSSKDLVVVDFRNGIEREKDEATKAKEKKEYEETVKLAEADVDRFLQWSGIFGEFYDPSADECTARGVAEKDLRPYVNSGSKTAPIPGANWVVGTAMASFAGMYGYQVEWMLPGKRKGGGQGEASAPKLFSGKVAVPEKMNDKNPYVVWHSEVLEKGLAKKLYSKGLKISKENDKRVFFRIASEDAQGNPVDKKKLATELVLNNPKFFEEFGSNEEKIEAAEKELDGFLIWVEFLHDKVSILDPDDPRPEDVKASEKRDAERMAEMEKRGDARGIEKMNMMRKKNGQAPLVAKEGRGALSTATAKTAESFTKSKDIAELSSRVSKLTAEINGLKAELSKKEAPNPSLDHKFNNLKRERDTLFSSLKHTSEQFKRNPSLKSKPVVDRYNRDKARLAELNEKYKAAKEKKTGEAAVIADIKQQMKNKESDLKMAIAARDKATEEAKAAEEAELAKKNRTDLKFLTAARTGSFRRVSSNYAFQFAQAMMKMAANCKVQLEWAVLTEPADKPEEIVEAFSIPAGDSESAIKFVSKLNSDLGLNQYLQQGSPRARKYFERDFVEMNSPLWFRLVLKATNGVEVAKADAVKNWLDARGQHPPSDKLIIPKKNLIMIAFKEEGKNEDQLKSLCHVWVNKDGNVHNVRFNESGMNRFFNAGDLSVEEFAKALVNNYPDIPSMEPVVKREDPGRGLIQETTWTYKGPKGYQVELFERAYYNNNGIKYTSKMLKNDVEVMLALSLVGKLPDRNLTIFAIKPDSARKFD